MRRVGHGDAVEQHRDDAQALGQPGGDLLPDEVAGLEDARPGAVALAAPALADQRQQHRGVADRALDDVAERLAGVDVIDVDEDTLGTEAATSSSLTARA